MGPEVSVSVDQDDIGEGAADIRTDAQCALIGCRHLGITGNVM